MAAITKFRTPFLEGTGGDYFWFMTMYQVVEGARNLGNVFIYQLIGTAEEQRNILNYAMRIQSAKSSLW